MSSATCITNKLDTENRFNNKETKATLKSFFSLKMPNS